MVFELSILSNKENFVYNSNNNLIKKNDPIVEEETAILPGSETDMALNVMKAKGVCDSAGRLLVSGGAACWKTVELKSLASSFLNRSCPGWGNEPLGKKLMDLMAFIEDQGVRVDCLRISCPGLVSGLNEGLLKEIFSEVSHSEEIPWDVMMNGFTSLSGHTQIEIVALKATDEQLDALGEILEEFYVNPHQLGIQFYIGDYLCCIQNQQDLPTFFRQCLILEIDVPSLQWSDRRGMLMWHLLEVSLVAKRGTLQQVIFDLRFNLLNAAGTVESSDALGEYLAETMQGVAVRDPLLVAHCANAILSEEDFGSILAKQVETAMEKMDISSEDARVIVGIVLEMQLRACESHLTYRPSEADYLVFWECLFPEDVESFFEENLALMALRFKGITAPMLAFPWYLGGIFQLCLKHGKEWLSLVKHHAVLQNDGTSFQIRTFIDQGMRLVVDHSFCLDSWLGVIQELIDNHEPTEDAVFIRELGSFLPCVIELHRNCLGNLTDRQMRSFEELALRLLETDSLFLHAVGCAFLLINHLHDSSLKRYVPLLFNAIPKLIGGYDRSLRNLALNVLERMLNRPIEDMDFPEGEPIELTRYRVQCLAVEEMPLKICEEVLSDLAASPIVGLPLPITETTELLKRLSQISSEKTLRLIYRLIEAQKDCEEHVRALFDVAFGLQVNLLQNASLEIGVPLVKIILTLLMGANTGKEAFLPQHPADLNAVLRSSLQHFPEYSVLWIGILRKACLVYPDLSLFDSDALLGCVKQSLAQPSTWPAGFGFQNIGELMIENAFKRILNDADQQTVIEILDQINQGLEKEDQLREKSTIIKIIELQHQQLLQIKSSLSYELKKTDLMKKILDATEINFLAEPYCQAIEKLRSSKAVLQAIASIDERADYLLLIIEGWNDFKLSASKESQQFALSHLNAIIYNLLAEYRFKNEMQTFIDACKQKNDRSDRGLDRLFKDYVNSVPEICSISNELFLLIVGHELLTGWLSENELGHLIAQLIKVVAPLADPKDASHAASGRCLLSALLKHVKGYVSVDEKLYSEASIEPIIRLQLGSFEHSKDNKQLDCILNLLDLIQIEDDVKYGQLLNCVLKSCCELGQNRPQSYSEEKRGYYEFYLKCLIKLAVRVKEKKETGAVLESNLMAYINSAPMGRRTEEWKQAIAPLTSELFNMIRTHHLFDEQDNTGPIQLLVEGKGQLLAFVPWSALEGGEKEKV
jgi:hypothetical protein